MQNVYEFNESSIEKIRTTFEKGKSINLVKHTSIYVIYLSELPADGTC